MESNNIQELNADGMLTAQSLSQFLSSQSEEELCELPQQLEEYVLMPFNGYHELQPLKSTSEPVGMCTLAAKQDNNNTDLYNLLKKCNVEILYPKFLEEEINIEVMRMMTPRHCEILTKGFKLGILIKLEHHLKKWQIKESTTAVNESEPSTSKNCPPISDAAQIDLLDILKNYQQGKSLISYFEENKKLNELSRQVLVDLTVNYLIQKNIRMTVSLAEKLANEIIVQFPTELKAYYFIKIQGKAPLGKLYAKYFNQLRTLKNSGLMKPGCKRSQTKLSDEPLQDFGLDIDPECISDDLLQIKNDNLHWVKLEECWRKTSKYRMRLLQNAETTFEILNEWKAYQRPLGYKLVEIDFDQMHPTAPKLSKQLPYYIQKFKDIFHIKVKDSKSLQLLQEIEAEKNLKEDGLHGVIFYLLHAVLVPASKEILKSDGKKQRVKFSIKDSQNSFFAIGNTVQEAENIILNWKANQETVQPIIIIIGSLFLYKSYKYYCIL